jgi:hypothetical protein
MGKTGQVRGETLGPTSKFSGSNEVERETPGPIASYGHSLVLVDRQGIGQPFGRSFPRLLYQVLPGTMSHVRD